MKLKTFFPILLLLVFSCTNKPKQKENIQPSLSDLKEIIKDQNDRLIRAAQDKEFQQVIDVYRDDALLLAEYNPLIDGIENIEKFYAEMYKRQDLLDYEKQSKEVFDLEGIILETGTFRKVLKNGDSLEGKYINVWSRSDDGGILLKTEVFGYFHPIEDPIDLRVLSLKDETPGLMSRNGKMIPLELQAYHALNENCVRDRDTKKLLECYTEDAVYYPFADTEKSGIKNLTAHFIDYHRNPVKIDSIQIWTYDFDKVKNGYIQYSKFYVQWTVPGFTGTTEGTGLTYYVRQEDNSLKMHRQIGLHIEHE